MINNSENIENKIEAILFLGGDYIKIRDLSKFFGVSVDAILHVLENLKSMRKDSGINIEIDEYVVRLITNAKYGETIHHFFNQESRIKKLSSASLETLSIIAYRQPISRSSIESIRGVNVDGVVFALHERGFLKATDTRPKLYEVTEKFLKYLGIESVEELPNYEEIQKELEEVAQDENK